MVPAIVAVDARAMAINCVDECVCVCVGIYSNTSVFIDSRSSAASSLCVSLSTRIAFGADL